jgi:hypothetical protein
MTCPPLCSTRHMPGALRRKVGSKPLAALKRTILSGCNPPIRAPGVSSAAMRPRSMIATRSQRRSASSMKCVTSTTVVPRSRISRTCFQVSRRACGSRPVVSSSRKTSSGSLSKARAMNRRCFWAPERLPKATFFFSESPHWSSRSL